MIGTDLAHTRMVVFPEDVKFYVDDHGNPLVPADFPIADAVRISAGFPYFFPPMKLRDGVTKKDGVLVDGGVVSAYPIFLFDSEEPKHPTWGFRLYSGKPPESPPYADISGLLWWVDMGEAILDTSMNAFDRFDEKLFGPRTVAIPTGDIETLDFDLTEAQKKNSSNSATRRPRILRERPERRQPPIRRHPGAEHLKAPRRMPLPPPWPTRRPDFGPVDKAPA